MNGTHNQIFIYMIFLAAFGIAGYSFVTVRCYKRYGFVPIISYISIMLFYLLCLVVGILGVIGKLPA